MNPFSPGTTTTISVTSSSGTGTLSGTGTVVELQNDGAVTVFVALGSVATTADYPVLPGMSKLISRNPNATTLAAITASGTATLYATVGDGV